MPKGSYRHRLELEIARLKVKLAEETVRLAKKASEQVLTRPRAARYRPGGSQPWGAVEIDDGMYVYIKHTRCRGPMKKCLICAAYPWVFPLRCAGDCSHDCGYEIKRYGRRAGGKDEL